MIFRTSPPRYENFPLNKSHETIFSRVKPFAVTQQTPVKERHLLEFPCVCSPDTIPKEMNKYVSQKHWWSMNIYLMDE